MSPDPTNALTALILSSSVDCSFLILISIAFLIYADMLSLFKAVFFEMVLKSFGDREICVRFEYLLSFSSCCVVARVMM